VGTSAEAEASFALFVRAHTASLLRTAILLVGRADAAEDLVQDTYATVLPRWHRVMTADAPLAYVRRPLINRPS
jgi:DNA-directed RNA polymerase specialized sigma24 family protein